MLFVVYRIRSSRQAEKRASHARQARGRGATGSEKEVAGYSEALSRAAAGGGEAYGPPVHLAVRLPQPAEANHGEDHRLPGLPHHGPTADDDPGAAESGRALRHRRRFPPVAPRHRQVRRREGAAGDVPRLREARERYRRARRIHHHRMDAQPSFHKPFRGLHCHRSPSQHRP